MFHLQICNSYRKEGRYRSSCACHVTVCLPSPSRYISDLVVPPTKRHPGVACLFPSPDVWNSINPFNTSSCFVLCSYRSHNPPVITIRFLVRAWWFAIHQVCVGQSFCQDPLQRSLVETAPAVAAAQGRGTDCYPSLSCFARRMTVWERNVSKRCFLFSCWKFLNICTYLLLLYHLFEEDEDGLSILSGTSVLALDSFLKCLDNRLVRDGVTCSSTSRPCSRSFWVVLKGGGLLGWLNLLQWLDLLLEDWWGCTLLIIPSAINRSSRDILRWKFGLLLCGPRCNPQRLRFHDSQHPYILREVQQILTLTVQAAILSATCFCLSAYVLRAHAIDRDGSFDPKNLYPRARWLDDPCFPHHSWAYRRRSWQNQGR